MLIVLVNVLVKPEYIDEFKDATVENARKSMEEPGIAHFDFFQDKNDPNHFVLVEVYRTPEDPAKHKETEHYHVWRDVVAKMMAEKRHSVKYKNLFPKDREWG